MSTNISQPAMSVASFCAVALVGVSVSGCMMNLDNSVPGVRLSELDMKGAKPTEIGVAVPDDVILTVGKKLAITIEGDDSAKEDLRFELKNDSLNIGRDSGWSSNGKKAIIRVKMPAPREISLAGSGTLDAETLAKEADISIAGSGKMTIAKVAADDLDVDMAGSGSLSAKGTAKALGISIAGSGNVRFAELMAQDVEISIAGSGDVDLASDGTVEASIAGSGDITVTGNATCNLDSMGSGSLKCKPAASMAATKTEAGAAKSEEAQSE